MSAPTVTLTLTVGDAQPILQQYAEMAARYGALLDHTTRRTADVPNVGYGVGYDKAREGWQAVFLRAKRIVESFGVDVDQISEQEAMTVGYPYLKAGTKHPTESRKIGPHEGVSDWNNPYPRWRGVVASDACRAASVRVVRAWRAKVEG